MKLKDSFNNKINKIVQFCCQWPGGYYLAFMVVRLGYFFLRVKSRTIHLNGLKLHYLESGKGPQLILLHGLGGSSLAWSFNIGILRKKFHILAPDFIGFGRSDKPLISYRISIMTEYLYEFFCACKASKVILVGSSLGGWVAAHFTLTYPDMVDKLILVDSAGYALEHSISDRERALLNAVTLTSTKTFVKELFYNPQFVNESELKIRLRFKLKSNEPYVIDRFLDSLEKKQDVLDYRLSGIKVPTLIIWGKEDQVIPLNHALRFHQEISGSKLIIFDQCGHVPQIEYAERFNREILHFLNV